MSASAMSLGSLSVDLVFDAKKAVDGMSKFRTEAKRTETAARSSQNAQEKAWDKLAKAASRAAIVVHNAETKRSAAAEKAAEKIVAATERAEAKRRAEFERTARKLVQAANKGAGVVRKAEAKSAAATQKAEAKRRAEFEKTAKKLVQAANKGAAATKKAEAKRAAAVAVTARKMVASAKRTSAAYKRAADQRWKAEKRAIDKVIRHEEKLARKRKSMAAKRRAKNERTAGAVGLAAGGGAVAGAGAIIAAARAAASYSEALNVIDVTFGKKLTPSVEAWAATTAKAMGRSKLDIIKAIGPLDSMINGFVGNKEAAHGMSRQLIALSADVGSLMEVSDTSVLEAFQSALAGQSRPIRALGVDTRQAALEQFALSKGIQGSVEKMSGAEKAMLTYRLIMEKLGHAQGDAAKTIGSLPNALKRMGGAFDSAAISVGQKFAPALAKIVTAGAKALEWFAESSDGLKTLAAGALAAGTAFLSLAAGMAAYTLVGKAFIAEGILPAAKALKAAAMWAKSTAVGLVALKVAAVAAAGGVGLYIGTKIDEFLHRNEKDTYSAASAWTYLAVQMGLVESAAEKAAKAMAKGGRTPLASGGGKADLQRNLDNEKTDRILARLEVEKAAARAAKKGAKEAAKEGAKVAKKAAEKERKRTTNVGLLDRVDTQGVFGPTMSKELAKELKNSTNFATQAPVDSGIQAGPSLPPSMISAAEKAALKLRNRNEILANVAASAAGELGAMTQRIATASSAGGPWAGLIQGIGELWMRSSAMSHVTEGLTSLLETLSDTVEPIFSAFNSLLLPVIKLVSDDLKRMQPVLKGIGDVIKGVMDVLGKFVNAINSVVGKMADAGGWLLKKLGVTGSEKDPRTDHLTEKQQKQIRARANALRQKGHSEEAIGTFIENEGKRLKPNLTVQKGPGLEATGADVKTLTEDANGGRTGVAFWDQEIIQASLDAAAKEKEAAEAMLDAAAALSNVPAGFKGTLARFNAVDAELRGGGVPGLASVGDSRRDGTGIGAETQKVYAGTINVFANDPTEFWEKMNGEAAHQGTLRAGSGYTPRVGG